MKPYKLLLIISFMLFSVANTFAQNNDMKARIEYEDAETAFQNKDYEKAISYLTNAEKLLGKWTAKISFLKIQAMDIVTDYSVWDDNTAELYRQVKEYMKYADKNRDKVDLDKMREIYDVEKRADAAKKTKDWIEMPEYKNGQIAYEKENYEEAINWYRKAIEKDNASAMLTLAWFYRNGKGVAQNDTEALKWYKKSTEKGSAFGMHWIGYFYNGKENYTEAMNWYKKAADKGIAAASNNIGVMYDKGQGVSKNYQEAVNWYKKAAYKEHSVAMYNVGYMYQKGEGVTQSYTEAMSWYKKSADKGYYLAAAWIGSFYFSGNGVAQDYDQALFWFEKATEMEMSDSEKATSYSLVANTYYNKKEYQQAMQWFVKAHNAGHKDAKNRIAKMYEEALGVEKDKKKAKEWRSK